MTDPYAAFSRPVQQGGQAASDPYAAFSRPAVGGDTVPAINFDRPDIAVRADIAELPEATRQTARQQWADRFVSKERANGGGGMALDNTVRTLARGSLVGPFLDELNAATSNPIAAVRAAVSGDSDPNAAPYYETLEYNRARDRAVDMDYPVLSTAGQLTGAVASLGGALRTMGAPGTTAMLTPRGEAVARAVTTGPVAAMAPAATTAGRIGQATGVGAAYGAVAGAGAGEGGVGGRAESAAGGGMAGAALGGVIGGVAEGAGRVIGHVAGARAAARAETAAPEQGALTAIARGFERDRIDPQQIVDQIRTELPQPAARARIRLTPEQSEQLVSRHHAGESADEIGQALGISPRVARGYVDQIPARSLGPLNIVDRASMVRTGSGENTQMTLRAAAATPGEARGVAREALLERQIGSTGRLQQAFDRLVGSGDYDGVAARHSAALQEAGETAYAAARQAEAPFELNPIMTRWTQRFAGMRGPVPDAVNAALDGMFTRVPIRDQVTGMVRGNELRPPRTLEQFISARQNLSAAIESANGQPSLQRALTQMRNELSDEVRRTNPAWGAANDIWRDGRAAQDMLESGSRMSTRLNARNREAMAEFQAATQAERRAAAAGNQAGVAAAQAQQELFRVGLVRALNDQLANTNATNDLTRTLRLPGARAMVEQVLGRQQAVQLFRVIDAEHAMHRTYGSQFGSQTTPLKEAMDDLNWAGKATSAFDVFRPSKWPELAAEHVGARLNARRNQSMMPLMTETDIMRQLATLRALTGIRTARDTARAQLHGPALIGAASAGGGVGRGMTADR